ncbi:MAG: GAF domain-containing protein, partial [Pseudomonadota bacterium]
MADDHLTEGAGASTEAALRATQEILRVISESRDDEKPVFDTILRLAAEIGGVGQAALILADEARRKVVYTAGWGIPTQTATAGETSWDIDSPLAISVAIRESRLVHIADLLNAEKEFAAHPNRVAMIEKEGIRTVVAVPLFQSGVAIGCLDVYRFEVNPFSEEEISLLETFAGQAVIAIENARQFRELQDRLQRETATKNILRVISQSQDDELPVFEAILQSASRLCGAASAALMLVNAERTHNILAARHGEQRHHRKGAELFKLDAGQAHTDAVVTGEVQYIKDLKDTDLYQQGNEQRRFLVDEIGLSSALAVPLLQGEEAIGVILLHHVDEPKGFTEDDISLVESFAAQAVIAIENSRQFRELQDRLEREAATREILHAISQSRDDEQPVFDMIVAQAARLCGAERVGLHIADRDSGEVSFAAHHGPLLSDFVPGAYRYPLTRDVAMGRTILDGDGEQIADLRETEAYKAGDASALKLVEEEGFLTLQTIPLKGRVEALGCIALWRTEVREFTADEIKLAEGFAAQAVIAIENVRQFREVQERLERETATKNILRVISQNQGDDKPVFDAILESSARLCRASNAALMMVNAERTHNEVKVRHGSLSLMDEQTRRYPLDLGHAQTEAVVTCSVQKIDDLRETELYAAGDEIRRKLVDEAGMRSVLAVPLILNEQAIGVIVLHHMNEPIGFSDDDVSLVESFAAQAVIAIENVRQFREVQERLETETATGEVLGVISTSRDDDSPVFDAILESAARLCETPTVSLFLLDEANNELVYRRSSGQLLSDAYEIGVTTFPLDLNITPVRAVNELRIVHAHDIAELDAYKNREPASVRAVDSEGIRTMLSVPLFRGEDAIGCINLIRREVRPFDERQIALIETFAAQAVIAIE